MLMTGGRHSERQRKPIYHPVRCRNTARLTPTSCVRCRHSNCCICKWMSQTFAIKRSKHPEKRFVVSSTLRRGQHKDISPCAWPAASQMVRPAAPRTPDPVVVKRNSRVIHAGSEILTAAGAVEYQMFRRKFHLHLQGQRISQARKQIGS
jgi:hypothetical protein